MKNKILILSLLVLSAGLLVAGCGQNKLDQNTDNLNSSLYQSNTDYTEDTPYNVAGSLGREATENRNTTADKAFATNEAIAYEDEAYAAELSDINNTPQPPVPENTPANTAEEPLTRKMVYTTSLTLETTEYEKTTSELEALVTTFNGYIEYSQVDGSSLFNEYNYRAASYTVRIPIGEEDSFFNTVSQTYHVRQVARQASDISRSYYDTKAQLDSLKEQYARLEQLAKTPNADLEYLLQVETAMSDTRTQINSVYNSLKLMDDMVDYSTYYVTVQEVYQPTPVLEDTTFATRIKNAMQNGRVRFVNSVQDSLVNLVENLPFLIVAVLVIAGMIMVLVAFSKRSRRHKQQMQVEAQTKDNNTEE